MRFHVKTRIEAPAEAVWALLVDAGAYPSWNSTVVGIEGDIQKGKAIQLTSTVDPKRAFKLSVDELEPNRRMVWSSGMPLGLFKGERTLQLRPVDGGVEFEMEEVFSGLMAPLITRAIPDLQPSFDQWGADLKKRAEQA